MQLKSRVNIEWWIFHVSLQWENLNSEQSIFTHPLNYSRAEQQLVHAKYPCIIIILTLKHYLCLAMSTLISSTYIICFVVNHSFIIANTTRDIYEKLDCTQNTLHVLIITKHRTVFMYFCLFPNSNFHLSRFSFRLSRSHSLLQRSSSAQWQIGNNFRIVSRRRKQRQ